MRLSTAITAGVIVLISSAAMGDLVNPDFSGGTAAVEAAWDITGTNWTIASDYYGNSSDVLKLTSDGAGDEWDSFWVSQATEEAGGYYVPANTDRLWFDAAVEYTTLLPPTAEVHVSYNYTYNNSTHEWEYLEEYISISDSTWQRREILLPNIDPTTDEVYVEIMFTSVGTDFENSSTGYFDNFQFVPEPTSILITALGGLAILRRKKN